MSEYNQFIEYKPQIKPDKYRCGLDSRSGEGMLSTEAIKNAPGLNPLRFVNEILFDEIQDEIINQDEHIKNDFADKEIKEIPAVDGSKEQKSFSEISVPLTGEILKNSPGLNTLHPFEIHDMNPDRDFARRGFPSAERAWRTSSGLIPLRPGSKINRIRVIE
ncbi:MAG: hypothetical protein MPEBLZ_02575 [Candidatus Methanoperedens nitroreducens]|uniref:Uncharacterized protein n=1 Tax=Candidatus Methanoperedens nitratireducens TaxID=1392998 RepID=A0A0P8C7W7_9EURY|nr:hypothetical protein [Candidatus Methanoperedens sp. BLZ2]KAB2946827.1 MAG: hypothetical protein F9K14_06660 [Candidatus Methanoperedens sp.]KPQ42893.1 MAG: hypothetical protein MPEBLZ_02575 [Candidatus Methanoperedens sp. BLZ1]MBZ0175748.1 hypothetical protein [Candidatus Methanoperedens nitroreducens]CAG0964749.1 hypothetical protein METP2_01020 [Methanosarcinales archaeon]MCX9079202.1 hypothetical protein [Candidatus Methanoperedens sp.]